MTFGISDHRIIWNWLNMSFYKKSGSRYKTTSFCQVYFCPIHCAVPYGRPGNTNEIKKKCRHRISDYFIWYAKYMGLNTYTQCKLRVIFYVLHQSYILITRKLYHWTHYPWPYRCSSVTRRWRPTMAMCHKWLCQVSRRQRDCLSERDTCPTSAVQTE